MTLVGAHELASTSDLDVARAILQRYDARTPEQQTTRARMLAFVDAHPADAHLRSCVPGHLTASALVVDARRERALLTFHKKLRRWLQLGGHCDGDANLAAAALREAREESGIDGLVIDPAPIDLDIHVIPARKDEPEHLHLDTRFVVVAPDGATLRISEESLELAWFTRGELAAIETDDSVRRLFALALG
ncbi:MAG: NUDIX hydrolase [Planctomycetota bacterium]